MTRNYVRPDLKFFAVGSDERFASSCKPIYNHANDATKDCTLAHEAYGSDDCFHKGGDHSLSAS